MGVLAPLSSPLRQRCVFLVCAANYRCVVLVEWALVFALSFSGSGLRLDSYSNETALGSRFVFRRCYPLPLPPLL